MSLAKWLNVPPGKTASGTPGVQCDARRARHRPVAATDGEHFRPSGRRSAVPPRGRRPRRVRRSRPAARPPAPRRCTRAPGPAARRGIDHQHHAGAVGPGGGVHPQRVGGGNLGRHDRRHHPRAEHGDRGADAESGEHVTGVVRAGRDPGQPDQARQQRQPQPQRRALQPDADRERRRACRMARRQRVRRRRSPAPPGQRHREAVRPRPLPDPLGHLVGEQAGDREAQHARGWRRAAPIGAPTRRARRR